MASISHERCRFVLLCLAGLCTLTLANGCVRKLRVDVDFTGDDIHQISSPDVHHCQLACTQHPHCLFFNYRPFTCYIKTSESGQPSRVTALKGETSGFTLRNCNDKQNKVCLPRIYHDIDFPGADYSALFTDSHVECQMACTKDPNCQFFSFLMGNFSNVNYRNKCLLKYSRTLPSPPNIHIAKDHVSGFSQRYCSTYSSHTGVCKSKIFGETDFPEYDIENVPAPSPEYCQLLCTQHPLCTYFSYSTAELRCYLKENRENRPSAFKPGIMSGFPVRFCEPTRACERQQYENVNFQGFDIRAVMLESPEACERNCTADPDCHFYTYLKSNSPGDGKTCLLKQVITLPVPPQVTINPGVISGFHQRTCKKTSGDEQPADGEVECGTTRTSKEKVVGGSDAAEHAWPWQVSLQKKGVYSRLHICGGSLILPRWVVTAAHCVQGLRPSQLVVVSGATKLSDAPTALELESVIVHDGFNRGTLEHDIALLKLRTPAAYSDAQRPVCLPSALMDDAFWGRSCWVTGWGKTSSGKLPDVLQQAQVPLIKPDVCASMLPGSRIFSTNLCAGYPAGGIDTCKGDSGGPLVCLADGMWHLVGLTSWGDGCAEPGKPGVYTQLASYAHWIRKSITH